MRKEQETTYFFDEIARKDLKRIQVESNRIYVACRNNQTYHHEPIYELAILNKDRTKALFCTEEDFFGRKFFNTKDVEFLEPESLAHYIDSDLKIIYSDEIFMARFPSIEEMNLRKFKLCGISFAKLVDLNKKILVEQRQFVDRKEKERAQAPIAFGDFERDEARTEPAEIIANPTYGRSKQLGETRTADLMRQTEEISPAPDRVLDLKDYATEQQQNTEYLSNTVEILANVVTQPSVEKCKCKKRLAHKAQEEELSWL